MSLIVVLGGLTGCTRNRATPAATPPAEAVVMTDTTTTGGNLDPLVTVTTPNGESAAAEATPTPALTVTPSTLDYHVEDGDTLSSVAEKFEVDTDTLRRLNYLIDDSIFVGQILQVPNKEGVTVEGMPTPTAAPFVYQVSAGDSLTGIALQFGVSTVAIMESNNLSDPNSIYVGQELKIPGYAAPTSSTAGATTATGGTVAGASGQTTAGVTYVVQPGDTLYAIAQKFKVDAAAIDNANNIANRNQLRVGQTLTIPGITEHDAAVARGSVHTVQSGESLSGIAAEYGVSLQDILTLNNLSNPDTIYVGQELIIPDK
ncbi:MAG: LysM peptidoglycan-binding domain-containing protein [Caldilineaceae bacterium]